MLYFCFNLNIPTTFAISWTKRLCTSCKNGVWKRVSHAGRRCRGRSSWRSDNATCVLIMSWRLLANQMSLPKQWTFHKLQNPRRWRTMMAKRAWLTFWTQQVRTPPAHKHACALSHSQMWNTSAHSNTEHASAYAHAFRTTWSHSLSLHATHTPHTTRIHLGQEEYSAMRDQYYVSVNCCAVVVVSLSLMLMSLLLLVLFVAYWPWFLDCLQHQFTRILWRSCHHPVHHNILILTRARTRTRTLPHSLTLLSSLIVTCASLNPESKCFEWKTVMTCQWCWSETKSIWTRRGTTHSHSHSHSLTLTLTHSHPHHMLTILV